MSTPALRFDPFPPDGDWTRSDWFLEVAPEHACAQAISEAVAALRRVFPAEGVHDLKGREPMPHPFSWDYFQRGGIRDVLMLGRCLHIIGSPSEIVSDLAHHMRYESRFSEARAGALFVCLGARVRYLPEDQAGKKPEFIASFEGGQRLSVEVKVLTDGEKQQWIVRTTLEFQKGIWAAEQAGHREGHPPSLGAVSPPLERLLKIALKGSEPAMEEAYRLGFDIGHQWVELLDRQPAVGRYEVSKNLAVKILPEEDRASAGQEVMRTPSLPDLSAFKRLRRPGGHLKNAARKFEQHGHPGILVLDKATVGVWNPKDLSRLQEDLDRPADWARSFAAILVKYTDHFEGRYHDMAILMPGPQVDRLPACFAHAFPTCPGCGRRHAEVDFLRGTRHEDVIVSRASQRSASEPSRWASRLEKLYRRWTVAAEMVPSMPGPGDKSRGSKLMALARFASTTLATVSDRRRSS